MEKPIWKAITALLAVMTLVAMSMIACDDGPVTDGVCDDVLCSGHGTCVLGTVPRGATQIANRPEPSPRREAAEVLLGAADDDG